VKLHAARQHLTREELHFVCEARQLAAGCDAVRFGACVQLVSQRGAIHLKAASR
jgi:hypothetical protein